MATYSVTTSGQTVATAGNVWLLAHSAGTANVHLEDATRVLHVLRPGGSVTLDAQRAITARTSSGTATLDVSDYSPEWAGDVLDGGAP